MICESSLQQPCMSPVTLQQIGMHRVCPGSAATPTVLKKQQGAALCRSLTITVAAAGGSLMMYVMQAESWEMLQDGEETWKQGQNFVLPAQLKTSNQTLQLEVDFR